MIAWIHRKARREQRAEAVSVGVTVLPLLLSMLLQKSTESLPRRVPVTLIPTANRTPHGHGETNGHISVSLLCERVRTTGANRKRLSVSDNRLLKLNLCVKRFVLYV
jgi:hypothetical protein